MVEKAKEKLKKEMEKNKNAYVKLIGEFLIDVIEKNHEAAENILDEKKTISRSVGAMQTAAQKHKVNNVAVLTREEGFAIVLNYFGLKEKGVDIEPEKVTAPEVETVKNNASGAAEKKESSKKRLDLSLDDLL